MLEARNTILALQRVDGLSGYLCDRVVASNEAHPRKKNILKTKLIFTTKTGQQGCRERKTKEGQYV